MRQVLAVGRAKAAPAPTPGFPFTKHFEAFHADSLVAILELLVSEKRFSRERFHPLCTFLFFSVQCD